MAIDTPAKLAILGGGPLGIEAALYARYLGYEVVLIECDRPAANVLRWGHVKMFSPFGMNCSPLGLAALAAQDPAWRPPAADALLTGREWAEEYLIPLAHSDLVVDALRLGETVLGIGKEEVLKGDLPGDEERGDWPFRLLLRTPTGAERIEEADGVIDATGVFSNPNWLGHGGLPAPGERELRRQGRLASGLPDVLDADRARYAGKRVLLVGGGYTAATLAVALDQLAQQEPETTVLWLTRRGAAADGPIPRIAADSLPERDRLALAANGLASAGSPHFEHRAPRTVRAIEPAAEGQLVVSLLDGEARPAEAETVGEIISAVGFRPDTALFEELQVHLCYASQGPLKLAAALLGSPSADCLQQASPGPAALLNPEPNFYVLGAKSYGRSSRFLFQHGLSQIRDLFTILGDRETLDLYASAAKLRAPQ